MRTKSQIDLLNEAISQLEVRRSLELIILKEQFFVAYESIKPISLFKSTLKEVATSTDLKDNIMSHIIGLATGYVSKKIMVGTSHNPVKRLLGTLLQFAISNVVSKHADGIKSEGIRLLDKVTKHHSEPKHVFHSEGY